MDDVNRLSILERRERELALVEKVQNAEPADSWQWVWQNSGYPVYVSHSIDITERTELKVALHQGDLFIRGWDEPILKISGAAFDIKIGQDENVVRIASSTGQLQVWAPNSITRVEARAISGNVLLRNLPADVGVYCQNGDLSCQGIRGGVRAEVSDGDIRLIGIEGSIDTDVNLGKTYVQNISSTTVSLKSSAGHIWLSLDSVSSGDFRCKSVDGDINLLINGELACELLVEASAGGEIVPVALPWRRLLERSEDRLHGILTGDGAFIHLVSQGGKIYIQEPWTNIFPPPPR